ncbi:Uncharacterised protein [Yersinia frederiksenii]|nr:Uncharacterised protein [Yersinia frederiksenii]
MKFESSQRSQIKEARLRKLKRAFCFQSFLIVNEKRTVAPE